MRVATKSVTLACVSSNVKPQIVRVLARVMDRLKAAYGGEEAALAQLVDLAVLVASADGEIDELEAEALAATIPRVIGFELSPTVIEYLVAESARNIRNAGVPARTKVIGAALGVRDVVDEGLTAAIAIAYASKMMCDEERAVIHRLATAAGYDERVDPLVERVLAEVTAEG